MISNLENVLSENDRNFIPFSSRQSVVYSMKEIISSTQSLTNVPAFLWCEDEENICAERIEKSVCIIVQCFLTRPYDPTNTGIYHWSISERTSGELVVFLARIKERSLWILSSFDHILQFSLLFLFDNILTYSCYDVPKECCSGHGWRRVFDQS